MEMFLGFVVLIVCLVVGVRHGGLGLAAISGVGLILFTFVFGYTPDEFAMTLRQLSEGIIDVSHVVTGTVGLDAVAGAFTALDDPEAHVKILVQPNG